MANPNHIELLRDDANYYGEFGKKFLSNSDIGTLLTNPKMYGKPRGDSKSLHEGKYFHHLLLEPEKAVDTHFVDVSSRVTKEYKNYCEANNISFAMLKKEGEEIENLVAVMKSNILFYDSIYHPDNQFEVPATTELFGIMWKGKADIVGKDCLIDLKTTSDINKFKYSAKAYNYDSQCYIYQKLFGKPLVFYVIDKETAQLGIFRPSEDFVLNGERKVQQAVEVYNKYFGENPTESIENHCIIDMLY